MIKTTDALNRKICISVNDVILDAIGYETNSRMSAIHRIRITTNGAIRSPIGTEVNRALLTIETIPEHNISELMEVIR